MGGYRLVFLIGLWASLIVMSPILCAEEGSESGRPSTVTLGVQVSLPKVQYIQGEEITVSVSLINVSANPLAIQAPRMGPFSSPVWVWVVDRATGQEMPRALKVQSEGRIGPPRVLAPTESVKVSYDLLASIYGIFPPGNYMVYAEYLAADPPIRSQPLPFTVVEVPKNEQRAFALYNKARELRGSDEGVKACLRIVREHPESVFANRAVIRAGDYLSMLKEFGEAEKTLKQALQRQLTPHQRFVVSRYLADALKAQGKVEEAIQALRSAGTDEWEVIARQWEWELRKK